MFINHTVRLVATRIGAIECGSTLEQHIDTYIGVIIRDVQSNRTDPVKW